MPTVCAVFFLVIAFSIPSLENPARIEAAQKATAPVEDDQVGAKMELRLSPSIVQIHSGDSIVLHIELKNTFNKELYVCRNAFDQYSTTSCGGMELKFSGRDRGPRYGMASDCWPNHGPESEADFVKSFIYTWLALSPDHTYGATVTLTPGGWTIEKPGKFTIAASVSSAGFLNRNVCNPLQDDGELLKQLPVRAWDGNATSNRVQVTVLPKK